MHQHSSFDEVLIQTNGDISLTRIEGGVLAFGGAAVESASTAVVYSGGDWNLEFIGGAEGGVAEAPDWLGLLMAEWVEVLARGPP